MSQSQSNAESPFRERPALDDADAFEILTAGELDVLGRMPWSSNMTFLVDVHVPESPIVQGVYKPVQGERPLWDFPAGLHKREAAAFELSRALEWDLIPPTVLRDGPLGEGSVQLYVPTDYDEHYFTLREEPAHHRWFQRLCAFDFIINSTDRKGGHILLGHDGRLYGIDNGLSFHCEFKLRTVIWEWAGEPLPDDLAEDVGRLLDEGLPPEVGGLLTLFEQDALLTRATALAEEGRFPVDPSGRRHPWPLV
ncbi:MAG: SCO1664 family protein [Acidimicrobiia bacterium]|nr:SCO1664 family protein [Acidimicrobiia bacterium]MYG57257.1 SCO1664 family protein [Acidimicrobiia bacterium]MYH96107.1 SCO1664 family protein [Acidimicrobiia bacterium]MYJ32355.1 SCO1664 family protein [Acidimicrobiia bacterium]MYL07955.1 SCO1664 family protein [Acidimicrobiia bacterium]